MAKTRRGRFLECDCAAAVLCGALKPHREKEDRWVLETEKTVIPVEVHGLLLKELRSNPERLEQNQLLVCWVRWNWETSRPVLTVVKGAQPQPYHRDHYTVRGTVVRIQNNIVLVQIQPSQDDVEPFEVPVIVRPDWLEKMAAGQRVQMVCVPQQGWLHVRSWYVVRPRKQESAAAS